MALGAGGIERGLIAPNGLLARHWLALLLTALGLLMLWMGLAGLTMRGGGPSPLGLRILADLSFVLACFANCFCVLAIFLRFATTRLPASAELKNNAYGMYLVHYLFVVWLQFALLAAALPAVFKGVVVFAATLLLSWGTVAVLGRLPSVAQVIGTGGPRGVAAS